MKGIPTVLITVSPEVSAQMRPPRALYPNGFKIGNSIGGPGMRDLQRRVFRDAERAVLQMNQDAFPELLELPTVAREFALWHECGSLGRMRLVPRQLTELFGDQDGVFPSACRQYRASMNQVASWALANGLMEYTGNECIPPSASLLEAHISRRPARLARLQRRDGFAGSLDLNSLISG